MRYITSQHYLNDAIVSDKLANRDFAVSVSPEFEVDGELYRVILDGHHSLAAAVEYAKQTGLEVEIEFDEMDASRNDTVAVLESGNVDDFLALVYVDGPYIDAFSHQEIW